MQRWSRPLRKVGGALQETFLLDPLLADVFVHQMRPDLCLDILLARPLDVHEEDLLRLFGLHWSVRLLATGT